MCTTKITCFRCVNGNDRDTQNGYQQHPQEQDLCFSAFAVEDDHEGQDNHDQSCPEPHLNLSRWPTSLEDHANGTRDTTPITSSPNAKWWHSTFTIITAMVDIGVLSLPFAMASLGWGPGVVVLVLSWIITLYTLWQMVEMQTIDGKPFYRYHELGQHAFGKKLGLWIVVPQQLIVEIGADIVFMVAGGKSLKRFHDIVCTNCKKVKQSYFIAIFGSIHFVLAQLPSFDSKHAISLVAAVMSFSYSTIAWAACAHSGQLADVDYGTKSKSAADTVFNVFNALGVVAFVHAGHNVVLEIQATIPSTPGKPSKIPMWRGVVFAHIVVALVYFPVALFGYWAFGNSVDDDILVTLSEPGWLIATANMMVVVHVIGSYQIHAVPVFDMLETVLVKKLHFTPRLPLRLITRSTYVALTCFAGISLPSIGSLLGVFHLMQNQLPCIMWLAIYKPKRFSWSWMINWICIILGIILMTVTSIGRLRSIIIAVKTYKFLGV